ncbi:MAG TPA: nuclear transport factor 2 family protein [Pyrinomonadaceae bacterium]|jgi:ketosteroid isomerase-like protein|nr:nuclear transport factor 2 family protein [Pyrinomonadaceae bacterium]
MKRTSTKASIGVAFALLYLSLTVLNVQSYPPFLNKAKQLGLPAKDCSYCHVNASGGDPLGDRAKWLVEEKKKRGASAVDVAWLKEYKEPGTGSTSQPANSSATQSAGAGQPGGGDQEFMRMGREWADAFVKRDKATLERILADDFMSTGPTGAVADKAQYVAGVGSTDAAIEAINVEDGSVRMYGDTAVVTGHYTMKGKAGGQDIGGPHSYTAVYVKRQGRWQPVAFHSSRIAQ